MANLKQIKRRIKSARNIRKITRTMKMVAVAKVQKAKRVEAASGRFALELYQLVRDLRADRQASELSTGHPLFKTPPITRSQIMVFISSDRGLCGSYNSNLTRDFLAACEVDLKQGIRTQVICVGKKAYLACKKAAMPLRSFVAQPASGKTAALARHLADELSKIFLAAECDRVVLVYNRFVSMVRHDRVFETLLPIATLPEHAAPQARQGVAIEWVIEPGVSQVLASVLPYHLQTQIYQALLSASAAEHAARMLAMSSATDNASDMIRRLTLLYNKVRQAAITKEILEIVGGAKALKRGKS